MPAKSLARPCDSLLPFAGTVSVLASLEIEDQAGFAVDSYTVVGFQVLPELAVMLEPPERGAGEDKIASPSRAKAGELIGSLGAIAWVGPQIRLLPIAGEVPAAATLELYEP